MIVVAEPIRALTPRQSEIVDLLAEGKERQDIALELGISLSRVKTVIYEIALLIPNPHKIRGPRLVLMYAIARAFRNQHQAEVDALAAIVRK